MTALRWGILSTARIGTRRVVSSMQAARRCEVAAIASREANRAVFAARQLGIPRSYGSYRALLADPEVDAVYNPLPNHLHAEWTIAALEAGKHVLCEKPIGLSSKEAHRMDEVARKAGRVLVEAFMYRFHPTWATTRRLIEAGRIGELRAVQSWFSFFNDDPGDIRNVAAYGGGAMLDIGCYCVDLSRMLMGGEPTAVSAAVRRDPASGVDVLVAAVLEFGDRLASFGVSIRAEADQRVVVYGSEGRITHEIPFNVPGDRPTRVLLHRGAPTPPQEPAEVLPFPPADMYTLQAEAFAAAVLDGAPLPLPMSDSIANMEVIERILAAG
ncbi:MAG: Gfo/Idh/MocA family oxidoreductase [Actinomycetota bacterium]